MRYFLLMYEYAYLYPDLFDSVAKDADFWPNGMVGWNSGKNGQNTPNWGQGNVVPYLVCKDAQPTQEMTDAVNNSATTWNEANPDNQTGGMQLIFEESEKHLIKEQLAARQQYIVENFE